MVKWFNVTSNSIYDIPRLSSKYSSIPLRINLPALSPMHNQKFIIKNNTALENRLLNAGLSPETVALYQRILDVAGNRQKNIFSSPQITDRYSYKPFT
jgi:arginyl-tRNA--protein-N-Asp/Glu arginylyltransferase